MTFFLHGLVLGYAYAMPIGPQNLFVIHSSLGSNSRNAYKTALIVSLMDISLGVFCFLGFGSLVQKNNLLAKLVTLLGFLFLNYYGLQLLRIQSKCLDLTKLQERIVLTTAQIIKTCFILTWFNPQALIDGSIFLGGYRVFLPHYASGPFMIGIALASSSWFFMLTSSIRLFKNKFSDKFYLINIICGLLLVGYGLKLGISLLDEVKL